MGSDKRRTTERKSDTGYTQVFVIIVIIIITVITVITLMEKTLIILKPDAVKRALVGTIIETFENAGLKLLAGKMLQPEADVIKKHYPGTLEWIKEMGEKTLSSFKESGVDVKKKMGTDDSAKLGQFVYDRLIKYWQEGPDHRHGLGRTKCYPNCT